MVKIPETISDTLLEELSCLQLNVAGDIKQPTASSLHVKWYQAITTAECGAKEPQCCLMLTLPILLNLFFGYRFCHNLQLKPLLLV